MRKGNMEMAYLVGYQNIIIMINYFALSRKPLLPVTISRNTDHVITVQLKKP